MDEKFLKRFSSCAFVYIMAHSKNWIRPTTFQELEGVRVWRKLGLIKMHHPGYAELYKLTKKGRDLWENERALRVLEDL
jgi:hypothetical protein